MHFNTSVGFCTAEDNSVTLICIMPNTHTNTTAIMILYFFFVQTLTTMFKSDHCVTVVSWLLPASTQCYHGDVPSTLPVHPATTAATLCPNEIANLLPFQWMTHTEREITSQNISSFLILLYVNNNSSNSIIVHLT